MNQEIEIGYEFESDVDADADVFAYNDDGEYATVFAITRLSDTEVEIGYFRCEAGLIEYDGYEVFPIDSDKETVTFAQEVSQANPEESIKATREYWA